MVQVISEIKIKIKIGDEYSALSELFYRVAQGSVLGPILFKIYIRSHDHRSHVAVTEFNVEEFADDHQLIKQFLVAFQDRTSWTA